MNRKKLKDIRDLLVVVDILDSFVKDENINDKAFKTMVVKDAHIDKSLELKRYPAHCLKSMN